MPIKGGYLLAAGGGAILLWSGVKGHKWSTVLRDVISGKPVPASQDLAIVSSPAALSAASDGSTGTPTLPNLGLGGNVTKNLAIGMALAAAYGWVGQEWTDLKQLWTRESGWSTTAHNPSGAYGIPQALPASKMPKAALPPINSATVQITWGLNYIKGRYGSPSAAWAHEESQGWY
jgi:resuscitation-promoting factor RpfB